MGIVRRVARWPLGDKSYGRDAARDDNNSIIDEEAESQI